MWIESNRMRSKTKRLLIAHYLGRDVSVEEMGWLTDDAHEEPLSSIALSARPRIEEKW